MCIILLQYVITMLISPSPYIPPPCLPPTHISCIAMYDGEVLGGESVCRAEMNATQINATRYCEGGVVLHPCCVGLLGQCIITTQENCSFQRGHWHPDKVLAPLQEYPDPKEGLGIM